jgi:hypothetical protein
VAPANEAANWTRSVVQRPVTDDWGAREAIPGPGHAYRASMLVSLDSREVG